MQRDAFGMKYAVIAMAVGLLSAFSVQAAGDPEAGQEKSAVCSACHGVDGNSPVPMMYPSLAGQSVDDLQHALFAYREGSRQGGMAALMTPMAQDLTDEDIADLAAFFSQQTRSAD